MPVPNRLNLLLVVLVSSSALVLLWLGSWLQAWYATLAVGVLFSYLMLTNYALLHEATHDNLQESPQRNYWLGMICGLFFLAPFSMIRVTHRGHHLRNRTDFEMFDLYYEGDSFFLKCCQWYGTLAGLFWPLIPLSAAVFAACPRAIGLKLFSGPPFGNASVKDIDQMALGRIRRELLATVALFLALHLLLGLRWQSTLVLYACFSFNWSTRQYVGHAFTERDVIEGAWNLRHNWLMSKILLHGEWDLNHHRRPDVPWYHLPGLASADAERPAYLRQYFRQWLGPRLTTDPPPQSHA